MTIRHGYHGGSSRAGLMATVARLARAALNWMD